MKDESDKHCECERHGSRPEEKTRNQGHPSKELCESGQISGSYTARDPCSSESLG